MKSEEEEEEERGRVLTSLFIRIYEGSKQEETERKRSY